MTLLFVWLLAIYFALHFGIRFAYCCFHWGEHRSYFDYYDEWYLCSSFFKSIFHTIFLFMIIWACCVAAPSETYTVSTRIELFGLSNSSSAHGNFILGSGTIDNKQYIFYNTKGEDGLLKTCRTEMELSYFDNNSQDTYLELQKTYKKSPFSSLVTTVFYRKSKYIFHLRPEDVNITNYYDISKY